MVTGTGAVTAMLTVYTTGGAASAPTGYVAKAEKPLKQIFALDGAVMSVMFFCGIPGRLRKWKTFLSLLIVAFIGGAVIGCGGMGNMAPANPATTTVTGTSGATVQSTAVSKSRLDRFSPHRVGARSSRAGRGAVRWSGPPCVGAFCHRTQGFGICDPSCA
jgi:hypothetical protein